MISSIVVLGVGRMGTPICSRLVRHGFRVVAFDSADDAAERIAGTGAGVLSDPAELPSSVDLLITVLPGARELENVLDGHEGILRQLPAGSCWLDFTSGDPRISERLSQVAAGFGVDSVSAPMGGGPAEAESGDLTFFVGGAASAVDRLLPVLAALAGPERIERCGTSVRDGQTVKLLANLLWFGQAAAVTEAMLLGTAMGVDSTALRQLLARSAGGSVFIDRHLDRLLAGDYLETFGIDRCVEELDTLTGLASDTDTPFALSSLVAGLHREALERFGPVDGELLVAKLLEQRAGRTLRSSEGG